MDDFEEALCNVDVFCKILAKKISAGETESAGNASLESMEKLLYRKNVLSEKADVSSPVRRFIPLPHLEEPLIDIVEEDGRVKILMQERCADRTISVQAEADGIEICRRECHTDSDGQKTCVNKCQKLSLQVDHLKIEDLSSKCSNNTVFEVDIPKKSV